MTLAAEEAYVRARWIDGITEGRDIYGYGITLLAVPTYHFIGYENKSDAWHDAYLFTKRREAEIEDLKEEVFLLRYIVNWKHPAEPPKDAKIYARILAREQAALAELMRGMKERG